MHKVGSTKKNAQKWSPLNGRNLWTHDAHEKTAKALAQKHKKMCLQHMYYVEEGVGTQNKIGAYKTKEDYLQSMKRIVQLQESAWETEMVH